MTGPKGLPTLFSLRDLFPPGRQPFPQTQLGIYLDCRAKTERLRLPLGVELQGCRAEDRILEATLYGRQCFLKTSFSARGTSWYAAGAGHVVQARLTRSRVHRDF